MLRAKEVFYLRQLQDILSRTAKNLDAFSHPRVSVAWQDLDLVYRRVHNQHENISRSIIGRRLEDLIDDAKEAKRLTVIKREVLKTGKAHNDIATLKLKGKRHIFDTSIEPSYDEQDRIDGLVSISIEVTDLVLAREQLAEANNRLMKLLDHALGADS